MQTEHRHIVITGQMAVGKSTAADAVARRLGRAHHDSDAAIEATTGLTGRQIAATKDVAALHRLEADVLLDALKAEAPEVISAAASTIEHPECRRLMAERAFVVVLTAAASTLRERALRGEHRRDIPVERLEELIARRQALFDQIANATISAEQPPEVVVGEIIAAWEAYSSP